MTSAPFELGTATETAPPPPALHHLAVQTADLANALAWYTDFLGCRQAWTLSRFSELTLSRLPGITSLAELVCGTTRFHLFERREPAGPPLPQVSPMAQQFQHVCLQAGSHDALVVWRERWLALHATGRYVFALDERPTDVVIDDDGIESFYCRDVNGLEFEFTYVPAGVS
jgi:catechol 2,3-dioxygenase-like lactoylglutathione lyase family enzyme